MKKILFINASPKRNGATDKLLSLVTMNLNKETFDHKVINLSDYDINYCAGCKICYKTSECVQKDDIHAIMRDIEASDIIVTISPSYWADITGQLKVFIDRCTPYCNTHEHHAAFSKGKEGYAIALRTGQSPCECLHIIETINHFYGHLEIDFDEKFNMYLCGINNSRDILKYEKEIKCFADLINCAV
ncbi:MAG: flavodoxin family protein [Chitinispirillales bacterium]|jgi:multimeric flavodoxin WrbA|nr:flavodoxin family protein [Chitinispirillales bacterium]